jgi:catechol 2,3-dioxygenase-like lactoylglutathione lyase family enzyme
MSLGIEGFDHVTVLITDMTRSRAFYGDMLGLREIGRPRSFDFKAVWYQLGDRQLHLLVKPEADTIGPRHFALRVADVAAARARCAELGLPTAETTKIPGADRFFIRDPDGNRIEIIRWESAYDPATDGVFDT